MAITDTDRHIIWTGIIVFQFIGHFGNLNVIYAHLRIKSLQTKYGILLSLLAASQSVCLLFELVNVGYGIAKVPVVRRTCFSILTPYIFMHCAQTGLMATISVDLLISIVFPLKHRVAITKRYLFVLCIPTIIYGGATLIVAIIIMDDSIIGLCNPPLSLPGLANTIWYFVAFIFGGITIATYIFSFATIYLRGRNGRLGSSEKAAVNVERKAMKSLSVLLVVFIVTRFLGTVMANLMNAAGFDKDSVALMQSYNVFSAMICYSSSFYVCFLRSSEYRRIFWKQIAGMFGICGVKLDESRFGLSSEAEHLSKVSGAAIRRQTTISHHMETKTTARTPVAIHPI